MSTTQKKASESDINALNKKIESLRNQRISANAKLDILKKNLSSGLKAYKEQYGVNLSGKTLGTTKKLVSEELSKVQATVQKEYDLKLKVVQLIEEGDIKEANKLLGIEPEPEAEEEPKEIKKTPKALEVEKKPSEADSTVAEVPKGINGMEMYSMGDAFSDLDVEGLQIDDTDDLEEEENKKDKGSEFKDSKKEKDLFDSSDMPEFDEDSLEDSDDDLDFGFGDMLKGSKFQI